MLLRMRATCDAAAAHPAPDIARCVLGPVYGELPLLPRGHDDDADQHLWQGECCRFGSHGSTRYICYSLNIEVSSE